MLKPAICFKEEIENALKPFFYSDDMMYYMGYTGNGLIKVKEESDGTECQFAVVDRDDKLIGYIGYYIDRYSSCVYNFGAFSFERGNIIMGKDLYNLLEDLINSMHRVEFRAVSGNPATRGYDNFLKKHSDIGKKHVLKDVFRDSKGVYHDDYIYEFVNDKS